MNIAKAILGQLRALARSPGQGVRLERNQQQALILQAKSLLELRRNRGRVEDLREIEFQVFSQFGEDGIIQYLLRQIGCVPRYFVEFGVQNYIEASTRFLLMNDYWSGIIIDGSPKNITQVQVQDFHWRHNLKAVCAFVTAENINDLISSNGGNGPIGLLSIDIDGNDYWVWQAIDCVDPVIVVAEYNSVFGNTLAVTIPYESDFYYLKSHSSGLYWGASLAALTHLATRKGYVLVGCNSAGNNAFFVKKDRASNLRVWSPQEAFRFANFRISRDVHGNLDYLDANAQKRAVHGLPLVDVVTGQTVIFDSDKI